MNDSAATYIGPPLPTNHEIAVPLVKHFKYTYQEEHRFCGLPSVPTEQLAHVDVHTGSLKDISDLIIL
jgi:hypothetical protein